MASLVILRGLPGSGKSTLAKVLSNDGQWPVFSIDDYFIDPSTGKYSFDFSKNHHAYAHCLMQTE
jgi:adenylate kinase family enzyme